MYTIHQMSFFEVFGDNFSETDEERLNRMLSECEDICAAAGVVTGHVRSITVNPKINYAWGRCIIYNTGACRIEINRKLMRRTVPETSLRDTILHELCHTVENGRGHKNGWRLAAEKIRQSCGISLSTTGTADELQVFESDHEKAKYVFKCCGCGQIVKKNRRTRFVDHPEFFKCGICGGKFEKITN